MSRFQWPKASETIVYQPQEFDVVDSIDDVSGSFASTKRIVPVKPPGVPVNFGVTMIIMSRVLEVTVLPSRSLEQYLMNRNRLSRYIRHER